MIFKKTLSFAASTIKFIIIIILISKSHAVENTNKFYSKDEGVISIMYHRFDENKYPSTNIQMEIFKKQIEIIENNNLDYITPSNFLDNFSQPKIKKKVLITIDDGFSSFYENAWPYLKSKKIPFILFVSTEPVGSNGYMTWEQINEIEKEDFVFIGNHSHSHEYLLNIGHAEFIKDINKSIEIFKKKLGYNPKYFSYPFGEYSLKQKLFIKENFEIAFGQHSGVIDVNKDKFELPRFPINEEYGDLERFNFLTKLKPLEYKKVNLNDNYILPSNNPPKLSIEFFENQKNIHKINCFSNEGNKWDKTKINFIENKMFIEFRDKFTFRRGRINCSMKDETGWRWFGLQFSIKS